jgi:SAM-dependent methyltransferase
MIESFQHFARLCASSLPILEPVYEFGSWQPPDQRSLADLRPFFPGRKYIGADMREGPGVDCLLNLHHLDLPDSSVGTALLIAVIEHVEFPRQALAEVYRVLMPGGWVAIASHMNFPIHSHPCDYWRFTPEGFRSLLRDFSAVVVSQAGDDSLNPQSVVGVGFKHVAPTTVALETGLRHWNTQFSLGWRHSLKPFIPPILLHAYHRVAD